MNFRLLLHDRDVDCPDSRSRSRPGVQGRPNRGAEPVGAKEPSLGTIGDDDADDDADADDDDERDLNN